MSRVHNLTHIKSGKKFEFIGFVQKEIQLCSYTTVSTHVQVKDYKGIVHYFRLNEVEFIP